MDVSALAGARASNQHGPMGEPAFVRSQEDVATLFAHLAGQPREVLAFAYLDESGRLLFLRHSMSRRVGTIRLPLRAVARDAIRLDAAMIVMAHNHPSGDPRPSQADLAATRRLATGLGALGVRLVEHLVLARAGRVFSLRGAGLL